MYFVVIGRIPGDVEVTVYVCKADSRALAERMFELDMHSELTLDEIDAIKAVHGTALFTNAILVSDTPIRELD